MHAVRNLARIGFGTVAVRYSQLGFGRTSSTRRAPVDSPKPVRVQGRNPQPEGRGHRRRSTSTSGCAPTTAQSGWRAAPIWSPGASGSRIETWDRTTLVEQERVIGRQQGQRRAHRLRRRVRAAGLRHQGCQGQAGGRRGRPRPVGVTRIIWAGSRCCAAGTTSPTAPTDSGIWMPGCSSSRSCGDPRRRASSRCWRSCPRDALNEYIFHTGTAVFAVPAGTARWRFVGVLGFDAVRLIAAERHGSFCPPMSDKVA